MSVLKENGESQVNKYGFDEAVDLTGAGRYNLYLLVTLSLSFLFMTIDMFGFSVVVQLSACQFHLDMMQKSILLSIPFVASILSGHAWGYISDTKGRKLALMVGMSVGFLMSTLSAFSPHWIVLGVCKFIGVCFCSSAHSATITMLGESCPEKVKGKYLLILPSVVSHSVPFYLTVSYLLGNLEFHYDLGYISFVPWRLVTLALAFPLGICVIMQWFLYESPKFLLNAGREKEALDVLRNIHGWNCGKSEEYPVQKIVLNECDTLRTKNVHIAFLASIWQQTVPLFKPPLLFHTLLLYYFVFVIYGVPGGAFTWIPFISRPVVEGGPDDFIQGMCTAVSKYVNINDSTVNECKPIDLTTLLVVIVTSNINFALNMFMTRFDKRRRILIFVIMALSATCCVLTTLIPNKASGVAFFGIMFMLLCCGPIMSYYVDLFPTSHRGMASSLGAAMARAGNITFVNIVGAFITTHCTYTFYTLGASLAIGALLTALLPPDKNNIILKTRL